MTIPTVDDRPSDVCITSEDTPARYVVVRLELVVTCGGLATCTDNP